MELDGKIKGEVADYRDKGTFFLSFRVERRNDGREQAGSVVYGPNRPHRTRFIVNRSDGHCLCLVWWQVIITLPFSLMNIGSSDKDREEFNTLFSDLDLTQRN